MPSITYILRFTHRDSSEIEEQEHTRLDEAWETFRLFAEPDSSEIYSRIELKELDWDTHGEKTLAYMTFPA